MNWFKICIVIVLLVPAAHPINAQETDFLLDERDGNIYLVTKFGNHWWMCQNLKYDIGEGSFCYDDDENNCMLKGRWYNFDAAKKACPEGYRLPADEDWMALESFIGMDKAELSMKYQRNSGKVGKYLKTGGGIGFDADLAGFINPNSGGIKAEQQAMFWTSTKLDEGNAWTRVFTMDTDGVNRKMVPIDYGLSVRCVKDAITDNQQE